MINDIIRGALVCPVCGAGFGRVGKAKTLFCQGARVHSFDIAASGYINLAGPKQSRAGDPLASVRSRSAFLAAGHYEVFSDLLSEVVSEYAPGGLVIDAGCGEGYYSIRVAKESGADVCGFDLSKFAVDRAARAARRSGVNPLFCVAGIFAMPIRAGIADAVLNVFAPSAEEEFIRVLKPGGYLITAAAGAEHLFGLKAALYDNPTKNEPRADLPRKLTQIAHRHLKFPMELSRREDIKALFSMTPYYYRTSRADAERLLALDSLVTEADIELFIYKKEL